MKKSDVTPPGREEQVRALKEKPGIDNPWAVAWASYNKDGTPYESAGAKPAPEPSQYEQETHLLADYPNTEENDDMYDMDDSDDTLFGVKGAGGAGGTHHATGMMGHGADDEESLLDDSETEPGEGLPHALAPYSDPSTGGNATGEGGATSDPAPENFGAKPVSVEGETENDDSDDLSESDEY